jgi:hypothetical protein
VSHCGDAVAACPLEASDRPTPASANADNITAIAAVRLRSAPMPAVIATTAISRD